MRTVGVACSRDDHVGLLFYGWRGVKTIGIHRASRRRPCHAGFGSSLDRGGELLLLIREQSGAGGRHTNCDLPAIAVLLGGSRIIHNKERNGDRCERQYEYQST